MIIENFPKYDIREDGSVYSLFYDKLMSNFLDNGGYLRINLMNKDSQRKKVFIHSLVAEAYLGPRKPGQQVNHIDGDKLNNSVENLEYCTPRQNMAHAYKTGLNRNVGNSHYNAKLTEELVILLRVDVNGGMSHRAAAAKFGISRGTVGGVMRGRSWGHVV